MIVALDVGYFEFACRTVGICGVVAFEHWASEAAEAEMSVRTDDVAPYVSGRFFERELPCLIAAMARYEATAGHLPAAVVVDGNVRLDDAGTPGLGMYLFRELGASVPVVGVAKKAFQGLDAVEVRRGQSLHPLHVTAAGMDEHVAARCVASMAGPFRMPTLLRRVDQLSRHVPT